MTALTTDAALLRRYAGTRAADAFAELVRRHLDLVYGVALRQLDGDEHRAAQVARVVFAHLSRKAGALTAQPDLTGWLFDCAHFTAARVVAARGRLPRREAGAAGAIPGAAAAEHAWDRVRPVLDDALHALEPAARAVLLARFFGGPAADPTGAGTGGGAARRPAEEALHRLQLMLAKRGIACTPASLALLLEGEAVVAAPSGLASAVATAVLSGAVSDAGAATGPGGLESMSTAKIVIPAAVIALAGFGAALYEARTARQNASALAAAASERDALRARVQTLEGQLRQAAAPPRAPEPRAAAAELPAAPPAAAGAAEARLAAAPAGVAKLQQAFEQRPDQQIPELRYLTDNDWAQLAARHTTLEGDAEVRFALADARNAAKNTFVRLMQQALKDYLRTSQDQLPVDPSQLAPYFNPPADPLVFGRYEMLAQGAAGRAGEAPVIGEKASAVVDGHYDSFYQVGVNKLSFDNAENASIARALQAYRAANNNQGPGSPEQLVPYFQSQAEAATYLEDQKK